MNKTVSREGSWVRSRAEDPGLVPSTLVSHKCVTLVSEGPHTLFGLLGHQVYRQHAGIGPNKDTYK